jgi:hypothetical protein
MRRPLVSFTCANRYIRLEVARALFEEAFVLMGSIEETCRYLQIDRSTVRAWREKDKEFDLMLARAMDRAVERAEGILLQRAMAKEATPVSQRALEFFLKHRKPEVYGDQAVPSSVTVNTTTVNQTLDTDRYTDEQLSASRTFLDRLQQAIDKVPGGLPAAPSPSETKK